MSGGEISAAVAALLADQPRERPGRGWHEQLGRQALDALAREGWLGAGLPEDLGGEGGDLADVVEIVDAVAAAGRPSPVPDLLLVTANLLTRAGLERPGPLTVAVPSLGAAVDGGISVAAQAVAWAPWATHLLVVAPDGHDGSTVNVVDAAAARLVPRRTLSGTPTADVRIEQGAPVATARLDEPSTDLLDLVVRWGALSRGVQSRAALRRVLDLTVEYVSSRQQFGRPLAAFQAVQQHLAVVAGEVATAEAAVTALVERAPDASGLVDEVGVAAMRVRVAVAAGVVTRLAHQLHGAMGVTREYELHRHTLALLDWRAEFGTHGEWATRLAGAAAKADDLWSWLLDET